MAVYAALTAKADAFFAAAQASSEGAITCRAGCDACCHAHLSVSPVEAAAIREWLRGRPSVGDELVARRAARDSADPRCVMLGDDGACAVYAARPLVCRTQGLALLYPANTLPVNAIRFRHPRGEVAACPLNYTEAEGTTSKEPAPGEVLDAGRLDEALATVNRAWCDASGTDPLARTDLREIR